MDARSAGRTPSGDMIGSADSLPQLGDVVEYPLSAVVLAQQENDRTKGEQPVPDTAINLL